MRIVITVGRRHYHLRTPDRVICPPGTGTTMVPGSMVLRTSVLGHRVIEPTGTTMAPDTIIPGTMVLLHFGTLALWYFGILALWYFSTLVQSHLPGR